MRGTRTPPSKVEEIKALSLVSNPREVSQRLGVPMRTVHRILAKRDNPVIEARREEKRLEVVDRAFDKVEVEVKDLQTKMERILEAIDPERIGKARLTELTTAYGTLFDKRQLLKGRATANVNSFSAMIVRIHKQRNKGATDVTPGRVELLPQ